MSAPLTHLEIVAPAFLPPEQEENEPGTEAVVELEVAEVAEPAVRQGGEADPANEMAEGPPGLEFAVVLAEGLTRRGWTVEYRWTTYDGHAFDARRKDLRYDVEVRSLDRGPREAWTGRWLLTAKRRSGLFKRLWPGRYDADEHGLLRLNLDETLAGETRVVTRGTWWSEEDFEARLGAPG